MFVMLEGKKGSGKTLLTMRRLIIEEILRGDRVVMTNVPILFDNLDGYLRVRYGFKGDTRGTVYQRVQMIPEKHIREFFLYRPGGYVVRKITDEESDFIEGMQRLDFRRCVHEETGEVRNMTELPSALYIIDEIGVMYDSRDWKALPWGFSFYAAQERKAGDDTVFVCQDRNTVDKRIRTQYINEYWCVRNLGKESWWGFKLPGRFVLTTYYKEPRPGRLPDGLPETFTLDVDGLCTTYDTNRGVGFQGKAAKGEKDRRKGIRWYWGPVLLVGLFALICFALIKGTNFMARKSFEAATGKPVPARPSASAVSSAVPVSLVPAVLEQPLLAQQRFQRPPGRVEVEGVGPSREGGVMVGFLDLGEKKAVSVVDRSGALRMFWWPEDRELEYVSREVVIIRGEVFRFRNDSRSAYWLAVERPQSGRAFPGTSPEASAPALRTALGRALESVGRAR